VEGVELAKAARQTEENAKTLFIKGVRMITDQIPRLIEEATLKGRRTAVVHQGDGRFEFNYGFWGWFKVLFGFRQRGEFLREGTLPKSVFDHCKVNGLNPKIWHWEFGHASEASSIDIYW